ncbi:MAG: NAD(P)-binding protein, partial [Nonomuraea sp.]|nr:NAD(P)-binding protein [Nonomuraea sp.]
MDVPISRRDLFDGITVGALGGVAAKAPVNPPERGLRGDTPEALSVPHALRDGRFWRYAGPPEPTGETYDLVVVGGGRSGLTAAEEWLRVAPRARVLVLDNRDESGGPAAYDGRPAGSVMCDKETFGADVPVVADRPGPPLAKKAVEDLRRLREDPPDWFPGLSQEDKHERLAGLTYSAFLLEVCGAHPDVERFCRTLPCAERAYDSRALGAVDAWAAGYPGFGGLGLDKPSRFVSAAGGGGGERRAGGRAVLRPSSPVVSVRHGDASVVVAYFDGHRVRTVGAESVIMACWHAVVPYLVPDLPDEQRAALRQAVRRPVLEATVRLRGGRART